MALVASFSFYFDLLFFVFFVLNIFFLYEGSECFCSIACPFTFYLLLTEKSISFGDQFSVYI